MNKKKTDDTLTIEDGMSALEDILTQMEERDVPLEKAFSLYEEGMRLLRSTNEKIDAVEKKVLMIASDGTTEEFTQEESSQAGNGHGA